jgi:hypothetical protein
MSLRSTMIFSLRRNEVAWTENAKGPNTTEAQNNEINRLSQRLFNASLRWAAVADPVE